MKKIAVITGASSGMGRRFAETVKEWGSFDEVWAIARRADRLEELKASVPFPVKGISLDLTDRASFAAYAALLQEEKPQVALLINASGFGKFSAAMDVPLEVNLNMVDLNCMALMAMCQMTVPYMSEGGRIINIASMYGLVGNMIVGSAPYHAAKGGVVNLTRALAAEWGKHGITVNSICPGYFYTDLTTETLDSDFFQAIAKRSIPIERYGKSGELDTCALFLASPASTYVNGQNIAVDGGYTCV